MSNIRRYGPFSVIALPRLSMDWDAFLKSAPNRSIALDGVVKGGPNFNEQTAHINFDHHDNVVREATMSTAMQVFYAIKGGLMHSMIGSDGKVSAMIHINDTDQDTTLAVWYLLNHKKFEGTQSIPTMSRLLALTDRLDITGGAFPMNLEDSLIRKHSWVFRPYTDLRKSGELARASAEMLLDNLEAMLHRLDQFVMNQAEEVELDIRHEVYYDSPVYMIYNEIGGNEARYHLLSKGMDAYICEVATRPDGRKVYTVGRRSRYIRFPVPKLYAAFNAVEGFAPGEGWNGSDIIGGAPRAKGSGLSWEQIRDITNEVLKGEGVL